MANNDQRDIIDFLTAALTIGGEPPKIITTHISVIFLSGDRALKLKRAVKFPFLDFRSLEARREACLKEIEINRRTAPSIYKGVLPITREGASFAIDGDGEIVDWLVDMRRFDDSLLFDRLASLDKGLRRPIIEDLADSIALFHANAETRPEKGGAAGIRRIAENNIKAFEQQRAGAIFDDARVETVTKRTIELIDAHADKLNARRDDGRVRACHGDLHLRNICLIDGKPTMFDAIEFSSDFSDIDVLYDLAFLLMDLDFHGKERLATFLFNRYLDVGDEQPDAYAVLPVFLSMRAQIRAHVGAAIAVSQSNSADREREAETAVRYLALAESYLAAAKPRLIAVGGLSGSGKSRLARELACYTGRRPGARVVRTDVVRKRLMGVHPNKSLGPEGYAADVTEKTYDAFAAQAREALENGQSVVMDAVFAKEAQRQEVEALAKACSVPFSGIWVDAPEAVRVERVATRKKNVSDATVDVAKQQSAYDLGDIGWARVDSSGKKKETVRQARALIGI
ncbi:MAG: AAA family ATPase [Rhodospirillales bacterium]|nr:AAA family ATPase [Rhodospirillales bacterium]MBO6786329.1 AAA family ATPase [Rhodospirillales bacterium]